MTTFNVHDKEVLFKIQTYELERPPSPRLLINVFEALTGTHKSMFIAEPHHIFCQPKKEFKCKGNSEIEALNNCLNLIKDLSNEDIFKDYPKRETTSSSSETIL